MSNRDTKDLLYGVCVIIFTLALLYVYFITSPNQVFDDCGGVDVPAHCVD